MLNFTLYHTKGASVRFRGIKYLFGTIMKEMMVVVFYTLHTGNKYICGAHVCFIIYTVKRLYTEYELH